MNNEEIQSLIDQLKAAGLDEDQIMGVFYETFEKGKMDRKDLEALANAMGYELTDEFKNDPTPDPIAEGGDGAKGLGDMSKEDLEDAKEIGPDETPEEFKDKIDETAEDMPEESTEEDEENSGDNDSDEEVEDEDSDDSDKDDEDKEWEEAQKMFDHKL